MVFHRCSFYECIHSFGVSHETAWLMKLTVAIVPLHCGKCFPLKYSMSRVLLPVEGYLLRKSVWEPTVWLKCWKDISSGLNQISAREKKAGLCVLHAL